MSQKSLFSKVDSSALQKILETPLFYECPLFLLKPTEQKIIFIRIYDSCILISNVNFSIFWCFFYFLSEQKFHWDEGRFFLYEILRALKIRKREIKNLVQHRHKFVSIDFWNKPFRIRPHCRASDDWNLQYFKAKGRFQEF